MSSDAFVNRGPQPTPPEPDPQSRVTTHDDVHHLILWGAVAVVVLAFLMYVRDDQRVGFSLLPGWPLPELCQSKKFFGWDCPGCGLTRSFIHLAHGDIAASVSVQKIGWILALGVVLQIPYRLWALRCASGLPLGKRLPWIAVWSAVALLVANWLAGLLVRIM